MERRRLGQRLVWVGGLVACLGLARPALAEEKARLVYVRGGGAEACPDEAKLRHWVVARLGYDPFDAQASNVVIARVEARERGLQSSVEMIDARGTSAGRRDLSSPEAGCQPLARALALSISLAIDPERAQSRPEPSEADEAASAPAPPSESAAPEVAEPEPAPPAAPPEPPLPSEPAQQPSPVVDQPAPRADLPADGRVFAGAALASNVGVLPAPALGALVTVGWRRSRWSLGLEGRALQSFERDVEPRGQVSGAVFTGGLSACFHHQLVAACLVGQGGAQRLAGSGVTDGRTSWGQYWAVGPRLLGQAPISRRLALLAGLEGALNLAPNTAVLTGQEVWEAPWLAATLTVGLQAHLP